MRAPFKTLPRRLRLHSLSETARRSVGGGSPYRTPPPRVPGAVRCPQSSRIKEQSAQIIISEVGLDMTKWNTEKQFCSFLGLCPTNSISGGKVLRRATRKVYNRAADTLRLCAQSLTHSKSVDLRASSSKPCFGGSGESTVGRVIPVHWCASVIPARFPYVVQVLFRTDAIG